MNVMAIKLVKELEDEYQRLRKLDEETGDVSLVDLELARRRAEVAREKWNEPTSKG